VAKAGHSGSKLVLVRGVVVIIAAVGVAFKSESGSLFVVGVTSGSVSIGVAGCGAATVSDDIISDPCGVELVTVFIAEQAGKQITTINSKYLKGICLNINLPSPFIVNNAVTSGSWIFPILQSTGKGVLSTCLHCKNTCDILRSIQATRPNSITISGHYIGSISSDPIVIIPEKELGCAVHKSVAIMDEIGIDCCCRTIQKAIR
jgi:hypothetical protein